MRDRPPGGNYRLHFASTVIEDPSRWVSGEGSNGLALQRFNCLTSLCHSIRVSAPSAPSAPNAMSSSVLNGSPCSRNGASGRKAIETQTCETHGRLGDSSYVRE